MKKLLKFESRKIFHSPVFYVFFVIVFCEVLFEAMTVKTLVFGLKLFSFNFDLAFENSPFLETTSSIVFTTGLPVFIVLYFLQDYPDGVIKNIFSRGYSRGKYYLARIIEILLQSIIYFIGSLIISYITFGIFLKCWKIQDISSSLLLMAAQYLYILALCMLAVCCASLSKKMGSGIVLTIFSPLLITLVLFLISDLIYEIGHYDINLSKYYFGYYSEWLSFADEVGEETIKSIICSSCWMLGLFGLGYLGNRKDEL